MSGPQRYTKRPVTIEAMQFVVTGDQDADQVLAINIMDWVGQHQTDPILTAQMQGEEPFLEIVTLEGTMKASPGDFIIRGVQGEFYPCKPDIFAATYAPEVSP